MTRVLISDEAELSAFLAVGKRDDEPVITGPELAERYGLGWGEGVGWVKVTKARPKFEPMPDLPHPASPFAASPACQPPVGPHAPPPGATETFTCSAVAIPDGRLLTPERIFRRGVYAKTEPEEKIAFDPAPVRHGYPDDALHRFDLHDLPCRSERKARVFRGLPSLMATIAVAWAEDGERWGAAFTTDDGELADPREGAVEGWFECLCRDMRGAIMAAELGHILSRSGFPTSDRLVRVVERHAASAWARGFDESLFWALVGKSRMAKKG